MIVKETICLNCGTICNGSYCPNCGQSTQTPTRITMRTFGKSFMMSFSGITSDFWETFVGLILHPWIIIKEYIHGKWTKYSSPIAMLMQLLVVFTVIYSILGDIFGIDLLSLQNITITNNWFAKTILSSDILFKMILLLPVAISCYIVYRKAGSHKYNFAEYFTACVYMDCAFCIYNYVLIKPIELLNTNVAYGLKVVMMIIVGTIALFKAFPIQSPWKRYATWLKFMTLNIGLIAIIFMIIYWIASSE